MLLNRVRAQARDPILAGSVRAERNARSGDQQAQCCAPGRRFRPGLVENLGGNGRRALSEG